jgi:hypothetical protein
VVSVEFDLVSIGLNAQPAGADHRAVLIEADRAAPGQCGHRGSDVFVAAVEVGGELLGGSGCCGAE